MKLNADKANKIKLLFRLFISLGLLYFIMRKTDFLHIYGIVKQLNIVWLFWGLLLSFCYMIFFALRSKIIMDICPSSRVTTSKSYLYYLYGAFYSNFLPGMIGGDVLRTYYLSKDGPSLYETGASVVLERISGMLVVILIALWSTLALFNDNIAIMSSLILLITGYIVFVTLLFNSRFRKFLERFANGDSAFNKMISKLVYFTSVMQNYMQTKVVFWVIILSFGAQVADFFVTYLYGLSLNIEIPLLYYFAFMPVVYTVTMIPVSINGIGLREGIVVFLFSQVGVTREQALILAFLIYFDKLIKGLVGGLVLLLNNFIKLRQKKA